MKRTFVGLLVALVLASPGTASGWGYRTHRWVNERAIETLPGQLGPYFRRHRESLSDLAIEPDAVLRKRDGRREAVRHFINLDEYGRPPFPELPRSRRAATRAFGSPVVNARGTLPWRILDLHQRLRRAFADARWDETIRTAGLAGHYIADAFMPLHTTKNHDGQTSGNPGAHRVIESELVETRLDRFRDRAEPLIGEADGESFDTGRVFAILLKSHSRVDELIRADQAALGRGRKPGERDLDRLEERAGALLAEQLAGAVRALGSFWRSAWEEAGRPELPSATPRASHLDSPKSATYDRRGHGERR